MGNVIDIREHTRTIDGPPAAFGAIGAGEKASLRLMASLMTFGPAITGRQLEVLPRRGSKRRVDHHR